MGGCYYDPCVPVARNPTQSLEHRYLFFRLCSPGGVEALANSGLKVAFSGICTSGGVVELASRPRRMPGGCWQCRAGAGRQQGDAGCQGDASQPIPLHFRLLGSLSLLLWLLSQPALRSACRSLALAQQPCGPAGCWVLALYPGQPNRLLAVLQKSEWQCGCFQGRTWGDLPGRWGSTWGGGSARQEWRAMHGIFPYSSSWSGPAFLLVFRGFQALPRCLSAVLVDTTYFRY